jgi:hypothetical protein
MRSKKALFAAAVLALATLAGGCRLYRNPHGLQNLPTVIRIVTEPAGAELKLVRHNLVLTTPADIELDIDEDDRLVITKEGYWTFRGTLADIPQIALDTYLVKLRKVGE